MTDSLRSSLRNIFRKKIRSILTMLGIAIGVASVIIIGNISQCGTNAINKEMDSLGLNGLTISVNNNFGVGSELTEQDLQTVRQNSDIKQATPIVVKNTKVRCRGEEIDALVWGIDSTARQIISLNPIYGRNINNSDVNLYKNVCLVDESFAKNYYNRENIVGKKVSVLCSGSPEEFEIIGIIKTGSGLLNNLMGDYIPNFVYVPYTSLQTLANIKNFSQIAVKVDDEKDVELVGKHIVSTLSKSSADNENKYVANNLIRQKQSLSNMLNIVTLVLSAVGAISLLVASLSIMTVMLVSVNERTREIGIKKSIGAKRSTIMLEFLLEATFLSVIGCLVGVLTGNLISFLGAFIINIDIDLRWDIIFTAVSFSILSGIIFGVYPAAKASGLKPVDALRIE